MLSSILPGPPAASQAPASPRPGSTAAASSSHRPEPSRARRTGQERARPSAFALAQDSAQGTANCGGHSRGSASHRDGRKAATSVTTFYSSFRRRLGRALGGGGERPGRHVVRGPGPGKAGRKGGGSYGSHSAREGPSCHLQGSA